MEIKDNERSFEDLSDIEKLNAIRASMIEGYGLLDTIQVVGNQNIMAIGKSFQFFANSILALETTVESMMNKEKIEVEVEKDD